MYPWAICMSSFEKFLFRPTGHFQFGHPQETPTGITSTMPASAGPGCLLPVPGHTHTGESSCLVSSFSLTLSLMQTNGCCGPAQIALHRSSSLRYQQVLCPSQGDPPMSPSGSTASPIFYICHTLLQSSLAQSTCHLTLICTCECCCGLAQFVPPPD